MRRPHGAGAMLVGSAASGVLAYAFFVVATRSLGVSAAAPVTVLWTVWSLAAAGLTFPVQHWVAHTVAGHQAEGLVARDLRQVLAAATAVGALAGAVAWVARHDLFGRDDGWFPLFAGLVTGSAAVVGVFRGLLTARGQLRLVGTSLVVENGVRLVLALALVVADRADPVLLGLALVAGQGVVLLRPGALVPDRAGSEVPAPSWRGFVAAAAGSQLLAQVVLNSGPVVLAVAGGAPHEVTALFAVLALFRWPYTLAVGAAAPVTQHLTRLHALDQRAGLRRYLLTVVAGTLLLGGVGAGAAGWLGPEVVRAVFGSDVLVSAFVAATVAAASVLALGVLGLTLLALATRTHASLTPVWAAAAVVGAAAVSLGAADPADRVAVAFLLAETSAFASLAVLLGRQPSRRVGRSSKIGN